MAFFNTTFTTLQRLEGYPKKVRTNGEWQVTDCFYIKTDNVSSAIPANGALYSGDSSITNCRCTSVTVEPVSVKGLSDSVSKVTVVYSHPTYSGSFHFVPGAENITKRGSASVQERNIETHPDWSSLTDKQKEDLRKHYPAYTVMSPTYSYTQTYDKSSYSISESEIISGVNQVGAPTGLTGASSTKWKKISREITFAEGTVTKTDTWQYDQNGWDKVICGDDGELTGRASD